MSEIEYVSNKDLCHIVWQNLISNAVKYTPEGGEICIKLCKQANQIIFSISNTGAKLQGKETLIFQSFYTGDTSHANEKGTGLGLPLVKKILDRLGGNIKVECAENTIFTVELPLKPS